MIGAPTTTHGRVLRVRNWAERYETHESRKIKNLQWVPLRNDLSDPWFVTLMGMPDGAAMFGAWSALLMMAARCHVRGTFADDNGNAYPPGVMASVSRVDIELLNRAIEVLTTSIPWFEWVEAGQPGESPGTPAGLPGKAADYAANPGLQDRTGQNRTEEDSCCCSSSGNLEDSNPGSPGESPGTPADEKTKWQQALPTCAQLAEALYPRKRLSQKEKYWIAKAGYLYVDRGGDLLDELFERLKTANPKDPIRFAGKILDDHCQRQYGQRLAKLFSMIHPPQWVLESRRERNGHVALAAS